jgi:hypothetical protein
MTDRTRQIVEALIKAPELVQALKQDPAGFVAQFGVDPSVLEAGRRVFSDVINRFNALGAQPASQRNVMQPQARTTSLTGTCARGSSGVPVVAVVSLAANNGMLAALGTVSVIGMASNRNSDTP